jgi:hypothetical protein
MFREQEYVERVKAMEEVKSIALICKVLPLLFFITPRRFFYP